LLPQQLEAVEKYCVLWYNHGRSIDASGLRPPTEEGKEALSAALKVIEDTIVVIRRYDLQPDCRSVMEPSRDQVSAREFFGRMLENYCTSLSPRQPQEFLDFFLAVERGVKYLLGHSDAVSSGPNDARCAKKFLSFVSEYNPSGREMRPYTVEV